MWFGFWPTSTGNDEEIPLIKYGDIKIGVHVWIFSHTSNPQYPNSSLTNTRNRENLAAYAKLENSHNNMKQPKLSIALSIFFCFSSIAAIPMSYLYKGRSARWSWFYMWLAMNPSILQLGNIDALEIGNRILLEIEFMSCMPLQN